MLDDDAQFPLRVVDLKQWAYCPRILYYYYCLPDVRPLTYKMRAGQEAGVAEAGREERRSLRTYGLAEGEREFDVPVESRRWGLRGQVDMVVTVAGTGEIIPVDYKFTRHAGTHFELQVAVYGLLLEEQRGVRVQRGFIYLIQQRRAEEVRIDARMRRKAEQAVAAMYQIAAGEAMPNPPTNRGKCAACEFRRFCNDVL